MSRLFFSALHWLAVVAFALAATGEAVAQPRPEKRVALVIGEADYEFARKLKNPISDARAVEAALKALGFKVVIETDRNNRRLSDALDSFVEDNKGADLAVVVFAGHGVQSGGRNYLLPTDAKINSAAALEASSMPLERVFVRLAEVAPKRIILLDACRNDPFGKAEGSGGRGGGAMIEKESGDAPQAKASSGVIQFGLGRIGRADGTVYGFATAPGATASDGDGSNSPFSAALAAHLGQAGLEFSSVMKLVQMEVYERTRGRQLPYIEDALPDLVFADAKGGPLPERDRLLLAMAKIDADTRTQVEHIAAAKDMPLAPLYGALLAGEAKAVSEESETREKRLVRAAEDFVKVRDDLKTLESTDPQVAALRQQAEQQLSLGAFDAARAALTQAIDVDRNSGEQLEARLKERNLSEAASRAARAGVASTRLEYRVAAADLGAAAVLVERWDKQLAWRYLIDQAGALNWQGYQFGDTSAQLESISTYNRALALASRTDRPQDWALTQTNLGRVLTQLGGEDKDGTRLEEAAAAYRAALLVNTRERDPLEWAATQNDLGMTLYNLGQRESGTLRLEEAVSAYRAALVESTRERAPQEWARTQDNLGNALSLLADRKDNMALLQESVAAHRAALSEHSRERDPFFWALTQVNLGNALDKLSRRENSSARSEEALAAHRAALLEFTRERWPLHWATAQYDLGVVLSGLGEREKSVARFDEAIAAYRGALLERTRERVPLAWERTQENLAIAYDGRGNAYFAKGENDNAIADYNEAIRINSKFAIAYDNRGDARVAKGDNELAVADYSEAIRNDPENSIFYDDRGKASYAKGENDHAIADYNEAIRLDPKFATAYANRGDAYKAKNDVDRAIADYSEAISINPKYSVAYFSRGRIYLYRGSLTEAQADFKQAGELNSKYAYYALWLDIAERRSSMPGHLSQAAAQLDMTAWPAPVVRLLLGEVTPPAVLAAANDPNPKTKREQVCEANFYSGELALLQNAKEEAKRLFRLSANDCPRYFIEWEASNAELKVLGAVP